MNKIVSFATLMAAAVASYEAFEEGSESRELMKLHGLISAAFTPVNEHGELDFSNLNAMAARL
jgi:hypothetical protein